MLEDRYRRDTRLGADASGTLYADWDQRLDRPVTVKVLTGLERGGRRRRRFEREARILGSLRAPALVPLYDVDVSADPPYMIFGPIPELSLEQHIEHHGPLPLELARAVLDALAETLAATHRVGFVHRDLHPGHVFLELPEDGPPVVKLLGFGRVRAIGDAATFSECDDVSMIPVYAAPELFVEDESDPRTDVYGLACIAYRALTGERPIDLRGASSVAAAIRGSAGSVSWRPFRLSEICSFLILFPG